MERIIFKLNVTHKLLPEKKKCFVYLAFITLRVSNFAGSKILKINIKHVKHHTKKVLILVKVKGSIISCFYLNKFSQLYLELFCQSRF